MSRVSAFTGPDARRAPRRMSGIIRKVRNKAAGPVARNPAGKRLCGRSALSLLARVIWPRHAPRFAQRFPHRPLRDHGCWWDRFLTALWRCCSAAT